MAEREADVLRAERETALPACEETLENMVVDGGERELSDNISTSPSGNAANVRRERVIGCAWSFGHGPARWPIRGRDYAQFGDKVRDLRPIGAALCHCGRCDSYSSELAPLPDSHPLSLSALSLISLS